MNPKHMPKLSGNCPSSFFVPHIAPTSGKSPSCCLLCLAVVVYIVYAPLNPWIWCQHPDNGPLPSDQAIATAHSPHNVDHSSPIRLCYSTPIDHIRLSLSDWCTTPPSILQHASNRLLSITIQSLIPLCPLYCIYRKPRNACNPSVQHPFPCAIHLSSLHISHPHPSWQAPRLCMKTIKHLSWSQIKYTWCVPFLIKSDIIVTWLVARRLFGPSC